MMSLDPPSDDGQRECRHCGSHVTDRFAAVHGDDDDQIVLDSFVSQLRGVIGRYPEPDQEFVFEFDEVAQRLVHMVGVRRPLQVEWYVDDDLVRVEQLAPWTGYASARADRVIERSTD